MPCSEERAQLLGYVVLTKRTNIDEPYICDHSGELWDHEDAVDEVAAWGADNPDHDVVIAAVVLPGE